MKTKIGILGSCVSRDAFNSNFVGNYKDFFEVCISAQRTSMISIAQEICQIDSDLIKIFPETRENLAKTHFISYDLEKKFIEELINNEIDYLIIDNYLEIRMGLLYFNDTIITNNFWDLPQTPFYNNLHDKFIFRITEFPDEYFKLWSKYCNWFFSFLNKKCSNVKVILNKARAVDKVISNDGKIYVNSEFTEGTKKVNYFLDKLDSYICDNFNVLVLDYDFDNIYIDENHMWGLDPVHYSPEYYPSLINKVNYFVNNNSFEMDSLFKHGDNCFIDLNDLNLQSKITLNNIRIKKISDELQKINNDIDVINRKLNSSYNSQINSLEKKFLSWDLLSIYGRCRIDFKNFGSRYNSIQVLEKSDNFSKEQYPSWFKSDSGIGLVMESEMGFLDLKIKCINDGFLKIWLRGPDVKDKFGKRFPVFIDYVNFSVNNKRYIEDSKLVSHDSTFLFKKNVTHGEILNIHIEWQPFSNSSSYDF